jgi:hypothetical protein
MIKTMFLVPSRDNDGRPFASTAWRTLNRRLMASFGGYTVTAGVRGAWEFEGRVYHDLSRQYVVVLGSWNQFPAWLDVVGWVQDEFQQEAIYIEVNGQPEIWRPLSG